MSYPCSDCGAPGAHGDECVCDDEPAVEMAVFPSKPAPEAVPADQTQAIKIQRRQRQSVFQDIDKEMDRQIAKFGLQNHPPEWYLAILMEEVGEAAKAALEKHFSYANAKDNYTEELVQIAAVAVSALLCEEWRDHLEARS